MKKFVLTFTLIMLASYARAYDAKIGGIYYDLIPKAKIAEVVAGDNKYKGQVIIPSAVEHEGATYNVTSIAAATFEGCSELTSVILPKEVREIRTDTFKDCYNLESVLLPDELQRIGDRAFMYCYNLKVCLLPDSVDSVGIYVFQECRSLVSSNIPRKLSVVPEGMFSNCHSLIYITIPETVVSIGNNSFFECSSLEYATLHVPESAIEAYRSASPWKDFGKIVGIEGTDINAIRCHDSIREGYYTLDGCRLTAPQKGINIIRQSDGTTRKAIVK